MNFFYLFLIIKKEPIEVNESAKFNDLEHIVFGLEIPYSEKENLLDMKYIAISSNGSTLPPGKIENSDLNLTFKVVNSQ